MTYIDYILDTDGLKIKMPDGTVYKFDNDMSIQMHLEDKLNTDVNKESEEKNMGKFKVGDIVRVKSIEEMEKSPIYGNLLDVFENTTHKILDIDALGYYCLEECWGLVFDDLMLEYAEHTKDDIFNINVIVPDKVVEIEFYDGKEKMVCHDDDVFDLKRCCYIAIAKHLYKKEYTYEGIEHMAEQLMYQKKYVKIVDKSLKEYYRKEAAKLKKEKEEEEKEAIRERQKVKRWKQKERRRERLEKERNEALKAEREETVNIIAEAIVKANEQMNPFNKEATELKDVQAEVINTFEIPLGGVPEPKKEKKKWRK